jgi:tetratricopeptide (TPR) repeat protein
MNIKAKVALTLALATLSLPVRPARAQSAPAEVLAQRAASLDGQGHHDLAAETWRQILSLNPNNPQALAALANYYRSVGDNVTSKRYMNQLRQANPSDPQLNQLQSSVSPGDDDATFKQAGQLASQHKYAEALALYRKSFHGATPSGAWAVAYYETEAAVPSEMPQAVAGLRGLVRQSPANTTYSLSLGRVLTYRPETRLEGVHILQGIKGTVAQMNAARDAWRQAMLWDLTGPATTETSQQYLARYNDADFANTLRNAPARQPVRVSIEGEGAQGEAYATLRKGDLAQAEKQFSELLKIPAQRTKALMGLGYVAMQRQDFNKAIEYYERALQAGLHSSELTEAVADARFWGAMKNGESALTAHNESDAMRYFEKARELRPNNPALLEALGRAWMQMNQPEKAVALFEQSVKLDETRPEAWTNWFAALVQTGHSREVVADQRYMPSDVSAKLASDPEYIAILAVSELQTGNQDSFSRLLARLHSAPETPRRVAGQMRLASLLLAAGSFRDAAREALEVIRISPNNLDAWKLVVVAEHLAKRDAMALTAIEHMPPPVYAAAQQDTDFAITLASVQQSLHRYSDASSVLESARARASSDPVALRTIDRQMAALSLDRGHPDKAVQSYASLLQDQPDNADAWSGLISALHQSRQDRVARAQMDQMPLAVAEHLQLNPGYLQVAASIYTETNEPQRAIQTLAIVRNYYLDRQQPIPYSVEAQRAWALLTLGDDNSIANTLVQLSHRTDLTAAEQVQNRNLWAAWSVRKALRSEKQGDPKRAVSILELASQAYPDNADIRRALAGTYVRVGSAKSAVALYEAIDWYTASKEDFLGAVSAASASHRIPEGRQWLANALERFPDDPQVLTAAAEFERSAGDMRKAKEYWRAVLNLPEQQLQEQLGRHPDGNISMPATDALARMLAPYSRIDQEPAASATLSSTNSEQSDEILAILPGNSTAGSPHVATPQPLEQPMDASPWLVRKATTAPDSYRPMAFPPSYSSKPAAAPTNQAPASNRYAPATTGYAPPDHPPSSPTHQASKKRSADVSRIPSDTHSFSETTPISSIPASDNETTLSARSQFSGNATLTPSAYDSEVSAANIPNARPVHLTSAAWQPALSSSPSSDSGFSSSVDPQPLPYPESSNPAPGNSFLVRTTPAARKASEELQDMSSRLSPWAGGTARIVDRTGTPGFNRLTRSEIGIEGSTVLGDSARLTVISKPTFLNSGTPVANANGVLDTPYNFGKSGAPLLGQPHFQSGVGGELQLATRFLDGVIGYTPSTFYVSNVVGSVNVHPEHFPLSFGLFRESVTDTMLSYAGERDPLTGSIWGGVVATGVRGGLSKGTAQSGFYSNIAVAKLTGTNVNDNNRVEGSAGTYWTFYTNPYGSLKIGANVTGLHYDQNQSFFTYGQGGYFSPDAYLLINAPFTWEGRSNRLAYTIKGSLGMQSFNEGTALPGSLSTAAPTAQSVIGANYNFAGNFSYKLDEHWYVGTFFNVNNSSNYQERSGGFSVRYTKMPQVQSLIGSTGLMDNQTLRPLIIP